MAKIVIRCLNMYNLTQSILVCGSALSDYKVGSGPANPKIHLVALVLSLVKHVEISFRGRQEGQFEHWSIYIPT